MIIFTSTGYAISNPLTGDMCSLEWPSSFDFFAQVHGTLAYGHALDPANSNFRHIQQLAPDGTVRDLEFTSPQEGTYLYGFSLSADSRRISWATTVRNGDDILSDLWLADIDGQNKVQLVDDWPAVNSLIQPLRMDGETVYFTVQPDGLGGTWNAFDGRYDNLYSVTSRGEVHKIFACADHDLTPCLGDISPDNSILAYTDCRDNSLHLIHVAALHSSGWGQSTSDDAILFVAEEDGRYTWHAFLYTNGRFADPNLGSVAAPVGLIYRAAADGIFQIQADGFHRQLLDEQIANTPILQVAPDGNHAAYLAEGNQLWLIDSATGEQQQLAADYKLSGYLAWGDPDHLIVGVWLDPNEADGPNNGHVTVVNIADGVVQILDEERLTQNRPAFLTGFDWVAFDVFSSGPDDILNGRLYDPESRLQIFDQNAFSAAGEMNSNPLFNAAWAPEGSKLSWLPSTGERVIVQVYDLEAKTAVQFFDWGPARFGALIPSPVWSHDGLWLALEVWANGPEGSGIWLLAADGSSQTLVDAQGHDPYWVNDFQLVFNLNSEPRLYDIGSGEQFRLILPEMSRILNVTDPQELSASTTSIEV